VKNNMIRIAFPILGNTDWYGGISYLRNLLYALDKYKRKKYKIIILAGYFCRKSFVDEYKRYGEIVRTFKLDILPIRAIFSIYECIYKLLSGRSYFDDFLTKKNIQVLSHSQFYTDKAKLIGWIPDFQHIHFPKFFSRNEIIYRNSEFSRIIRNSERVILLSNDAYNDFRHFAPQYIKKACVLHFVTNIDSSVYSIHHGSIVRKYHIPSKYLYIPNQFWVHKNHQIVIKALAETQKKGYNIFLVCSGYMKDRRNISYISELKNLVESLHVSSKIKFLGFIPHDDVLQLMRYSVAIVNPSLFEGWSTSVEEAKSLGKSIILSNINAHQEQKPPSVIYFSPTDVSNLSNILIKTWDKSSGGPDYRLEARAKQKLKRRIKQYADDYDKIISEII